MGKISFAIDSGLFSGIYPGSWAVPQEMPARADKSRRNLKIGIPKEGFFQENRVALTPSSAAVLVANGHEVYIEHKAGEGARFTDKDYSEVGVIICYKREDVFKQADFILKISPLSGEELALLRENQT